MTFREKTVIRILLLVARIVAEDDTLRESIKELHNHISVGPWRGDDK